MKTFKQFLNESNEHKDIRLNERLNIDDYEVYKSDSGWWNVRPKTKGVPYIHSPQSFKDALRARNFLGMEVWKYNTKDIMNDRKALISKLHKLFKAEGLNKCKDMTSSVRGYRPIAEHGYRIYTLNGDRTNFYISFTSESIEKAYKPKVLKILDKEGVKYDTRYGDIGVDMEKQ